MANKSRKAVAVKSPEQKEADLQARLKEVEERNAEVEPIILALDDALKMALAQSGWVPTENRYGPRGATFRSEIQIAPDEPMLLVVADDVYLGVDVAFGCHIGLRLHSGYGYGEQRPAGNVSLPNHASGPSLAALPGILAKAATCVGVFETRAAYLLERLARSGNKRAAHKGD